MSFQCTSIAVGRKKPHEEKKDEPYVEKYEIVEENLRIDQIQEYHKLKVYRKNGVNGSIRKNYSTKGRRRSSSRDGNSSS